jgi:hypothetical protein
MMILPHTTTSKDIQRSYRSVFDTAKTQGPVIVMTNNRPDVAIVSIPHLKDLYEKSADFEMREALRAIKEYGRAKKKGTLVKASSVNEILQ